MLDDAISAPIPADLRRWYLEAGLWDDTSLGGLLAAGLRGHRGQTVRVWSKIAPSPDLPGTRRVVATFRGGAPSARCSSRRLRHLPAAQGRGTAATFVGLAALGAVLVPVAGLYGRKELIDVVNAVQASVLVTAATHAHRKLPCRASRFAGCDADSRDGGVVRQPTGRRREEVSTTWSPPPCWRPSPRWSSTALSGGLHLGNVGSVERGGPYSPLAGSRGAATPRGDGAPECDAGWAT